MLRELTRSSAAVGQAVPDVLAPSQGVFGDSLVIGKGRVVGSFALDPEGVSLKTGLSMSSASQTLAPLLPVGASLLGLGIMAWGFKKMLEGI